MTLLPGLCSVTVRHLDIEEVARLAAEAGLRAIEWGGDVHVPAGDAEAARRARGACDAAGLVCASYGSYLLADGDSSEEAVTRVLDTALELGAPTVRVWTPVGIEPGSPRTGGVVEALVQISTAALDRSLAVGIEFHGGTLTATADSATAVLDAVGAPNLSTLWQPPYWLATRPPADDAEEIARLEPRLSNLHVYEWASAEDRRPLAEGRARWQAVFGVLHEAPPSVRALMRVAFLEFVAGDDPRNVLQDAHTLRDLLGEQS